MTPEERIRMKAETVLLADCGRASRARYVSGCRCRACKAAANAYEKDRVRRKAYGRLDRVDAEPVREHVRYLMRLGYSRKEIARVSGVSITCMASLMVAHHRTGRPVKTMKRANAEAIMALDGSRRRLGMRQVVKTRMPADIRRLKLQGMSIAEMARMSGVSKQVLYALYEGRRDHVLAATHAQWMRALPELERRAS